MQGLAGYGPRVASAALVARERKRPFWNLEPTPFVRELPVRGPRRERLMVDRVDALLLRLATTCYLRRITLTRLELIRHQELHPSETRQGQLEDLDWQIREIRKLDYLLSQYAFDGVIVNGYYKQADD